MKARSAAIAYLPVDRPSLEKAKSQSLARGLAVLQAFDVATPEAGIRELSRRLKLDRSTVFRLVRTLLDNGFLEQNPITQKYRIGPRTFEVGQRYTSSGPLYNVAAREIRRLHEEHDVDCYLAVRLNTVLLYLTALESEDVVFRAVAGTRGHLHSTSLGKMLLASEPPAVAKSIMARISMPRLTPATKTSRAALASDVAKARQRGYSIADGENLAGVFSVAAPIRNAHGKVVAAISGSYPKESLSKKRVAAMIAAVTRCAAAISAQLGAPPLVAGMDSTPPGAEPIRMAPRGKPARR